MLTQVYQKQFDKKIDLANLRCIDYGYECDFSSEGEIEQVIQEFAKHTEEEHGIEYQREALMQFILRKTQSSVPLNDHLISS